MSEPDDVLDLENPPHFDPDKWIGKGRAYTAKPEDVPRELSLYCDHLLTAEGNGGSYGFVLVNKQVMLGKGKVLNKC